MEVSKIHTHAQCQNALANIGDALYVIGGKWKLRVIMSVREGNHRFNEIQRALDGISARVLSNELKELELNGFLQRKVFTGTPVTVEYHATDYAASLNEVLNALSSWGYEHREKLKAERRSQKSA